MITPESDQQRIDSILKTREEVIPLLSFRGPGLEPAIDRLTQEQIAGRETLERVHKFLEPFTISLHTAFGDMRDHPEQLLRMEGMNIQFGLDSSPSDYQVFISMEQQGSSLSSLVSFWEPEQPKLLKAVTFCHAPTQRSSELLTKLMSTKEVSGTNENLHPSMINIPRTDSYALGLIFGQGLIKHILFRYIESSVYRDLWYELADQQVIVREKFTRTSTWGMDIIRYLLCSDGKLRREFYDKDKGITTNNQSATLEEEIKTIFARLPFEDYSLKMPDFES